MSDINYEYVAILRNHLLAGFNVALEDLPNDTRLSKAEILIALDQVRSDVWTAISIRDNNKRARRGH